VKGRGVRAQLSRGKRIGWELEPCPQGRNFQVGFRLESGEKIRSADVIIKRGVSRFRAWRSHSVYFMHIALLFCLNAPSRLLGRRCQPGSDLGPAACSALVWWVDERK
jgi:hypothetical protein